MLIESLKRSQKKRIARWVPRLTQVQDEAVTLTGPAICHINVNSWGIEPHHKNEVAVKSQPVMKAEPEKSDAQLHNQTLHPLFWASF